jgi:hypothetical protein
MGAFLLFMLQNEKKLMSSRSVLLTTTLSISWWAKSFRTSGR